MVKSTKCTLYSITSQPNKSPGRAAAPSSGIENVAASLRIGEFGFNAIYIFMYFLYFILYFSAEKAKKKASDKNKKSGFVVNKQARAVEEDEMPKKKSSKKATPPAPKVSP